jgi:hypothetical protein
MQRIEKSKINLDWSRLLGFDQVPTAAVDPATALKLSHPRLAKVGAKPAG